MLKELPLVGDVRGMGLMTCIENVANKQTKELLPDELDIGARISRAAEEQGLIVRPIGHLNVLSPALTISETEIDQIGEILEKSIRTVADDLIKEGVKLG